MLGRVSGVLQGGSNSVSQVDGLGYGTSLLALWGAGFRKETIASACLEARYFSFSLYSTGAFQVATLVLELRRSESV